jgi:regulatory protein
LPLFDLANVPQLRKREPGSRTPQALLASRAACFYAFCMFGRQRKLDSEDELYDVAVRALMRRGHSVNEMQKLLARRADNELLVKVVLARLRENGQLDDARYAKQFVRQRTEIRRQGKYRITRDLRARGVPDEHIESALAESAEQTDETALVRQRIERKLKLTRGEVDERKIASLYRSLMRAGFAPDLIRRELQSMTKAQVPEVESATE